MNYLDYLDWRGDIDFSYKPLNDIDNLILSEIAYVDMEGLVSSDLVFDTTPPQLLAKYRVARRSQDTASNNPIPLFEKAAYCDRFKDIPMGGHLEIWDKEHVVQISAVTFLLDDNTAYVAFRGTDNTMTGWREDFNFGYLSETPGQKAAVKYLERVHEKLKCKLYVGGHSKGGNFAVYAAAFAKPSVKDAIIRVYSNDGPGFTKEIVESEQYASIADRIRKIVPESSIIGTLLFGKEPFHIIQSEGKGMEQHSPYRWQIHVNDFVPAEQLSFSSTVMDEAFDRWVNELEPEQRQAVIASLFDSIEAAGYSTMPELMEHKLEAYNAIVKAFKELEEVHRNSASAALKRLASISKDVLWDDAKKKFLPTR